MKPKISLITGASGEIGQNLISYFSKSNNKKIVALDLNKPNKNIDVFKFIEGSILDGNILDGINEKYIVEEIFHLAAVLSTKAEKNKGLAQEVNIGGRINLLKLALSQYSNNNTKTKFFFPSSIAVYNIEEKNNHSKNNINENSYCNPKTIYGQHKLLCENLGTALNNDANEQKLKIDFRCIRFPGIISINSMPTGGTSDYAPEMIESARQLKSYSCYVSNNCKIPFIVMPDAIDGIIKLMTCNKSKLINNVYNITSFSPTVSEFYNEIKLYYKNFILTYDINNQRQKIIDSWPGILNDSIAKKHWGWKAKYNFKKSFNDYLFLKL